MRWFAAVAALWLCGVPSALAQSGDWLVLPTTTDDEISWMQPTVREVSRELRKQGVGVWSPDRSAARLQQRGPVPPAIVSDAAIEAWATRSDDAIRRLATGDAEGALGELEEAQAFSRKALETLNRDPTRARKVLDTCLYLVRALSEKGNEGRAVTQAQECVRTAPSAEPTQYMHPPNVLELYEAAAKPGPAHASTLLVESEPSGCPARVNGAPVGETPAELSDLYPGEYRVQVECDSELPGRVHVVAVPPGNTSLFVFDHFDRAVRSTPVLHLRYDEQPGAQRLARDARELARVLPASAVVVASMTGSDTVELRLATRTQMESALVKIAITDSGPDTAVVTKATAALLARECGDFTGSEPVMFDCTTGEIIAMVEPEPQRGRPPPGQFISGVSMASLGTASLLAGYGLLIVRKSAGDDWIADQNSLDAQEKWLSLGTGLIATGAAGSGLLVAAMPLVLPYRAKTPWWAWLSGGLGVAAAAVSVASAVTADPKPSESCSINGLDPTPCVNRARQTDRAILLGMTAAPLLTMPLVFLLRRGDKKVDVALTPSLHASRQGGAVGLQGVF